MRDPQRIPRICKKIEQLWSQVPEQRLGQFLENYVFGHHLITGNCIFHIEDTNTEKVLDELLKEKK